jgi:hypothetical protein
MAASLETTVKAEAIAAAIRAATGTSPEVIYTNDTASLIFTDEGAKKLRYFIETQMAKKGGKINIALAPVIVPLIIKKAWPIAAAATLALILTGYLFARATSRTRGR